MSFKIKPLDYADYKKISSTEFHRRIRNKIIFFHHRGTESTETAEFILSLYSWFKIETTGLHKISTRSKID